MSTAIRRWAEKRETATAAAVAPWAVPEIADWCEGIAAGDVVLVPIGDGTYRAARSYEHYVICRDGGAFEVANAEEWRDRWEPLDPEPEPEPDPETGGGDDSDLG